jgi:hypothetical protein
MQEKFRAVAGTDSAAWNNNNKEDHVFAVLRIVYPSNLPVGKDSHDNPPIPLCVLANRRISSDNKESMVFFD